jgi:hypothetical protein
MLSHILGCRQNDPRKTTEYEGWGAGVIPKLANDLKNDLSEVKGFSERNLNNMISFYQEYSSLSLIWQPSVAKLETSTESIGKPPVSQLESGTKSIGKPPVSQLEKFRNVLIRKRKSNKS